MMIDRFVQILFPHFLVFSVHGVADGSGVLDRHRRVQKRVLLVLCVQWCRGETMGAGIGVEGVS